MIECLCGSLVLKTPTYAVVDVNGVGFGLSISVATSERLPGIGAGVRVLTHLYVREDRLALFGFADERERSMFRLLIGVPGIGPHLAQAVLSGMALPELEEAIYHGRASELTSVRGIGRKTAERIVLDLRDRVLPAGGAAVKKPGGATASSGPEADAEMALVALGVSPAAARKAVEKVKASCGAGMSVEEMIKQALRER